MPRTRRKLMLSKETLRSVAGGPGHRTTNRCTQNVWQTCDSWCGTCTACNTECNTGCATDCVPSECTCPTDQTCWTGCIC